VAHRDAWSIVLESGDRKTVQGGLTHTAVGDDRPATFVDTGIFRRDRLSTAPAALAPPAPPFEQAVAMFSLARIATPAGE